MARMSFVRDAAARKLARIEALLVERHLTIVQLADAVHISKRGAVEYVNRLHTEGKIHIEAWVYEVTGSRRYPRAAYRFGYGIDAPKPAPTTAAERAKKYRAKVKKDPDRMNRARAIRRIRDTGPRPDPAAAWLFGGKA